MAKGPYIDPLDTVYPGGISVRLIDDFNADPSYVESMKQNLDESLGDVAPEISSAISDRISRGMKLLGEKAPRNPGGKFMTMTPGVDDVWRPGPGESAKFSRYAEAVNNPASVIEGIVNGKLNEEGAEVLRTVYPSMRDEFVRGLVERVSESKKPIPYNKRVALALLLGIPNTDPTLIPEYIASMQEGFKKQAETQQPQPITNNAARSMEKNREQNMTQTDRIASGQE